MNRNGNDFSCSLALVSDTCWARKAMNVDGDGPVDHTVRFLLGGFRVDAFMLRTMASDACV
jgi:hypothetical protein